MGEPPLAGRPDGAGQLAQPSGPPPAAGRERTPPRLPAPALRGERSDAPLGVRALRRPLAPQLLIPPTLGMPLLHLRARGAPDMVRAEGSRPCATPARARGTPRQRQRASGAGWPSRVPPDGAREGPSSSGPTGDRAGGARGLTPPPPLPERCRPLPGHSTASARAASQGGYARHGAARSHPQPRARDSPPQTSAPCRALARQAARETGERHPRLDAGPSSPGGVPPGGDPGLPRRGRRRLLGEGHPLPDGRLARASAQRLQGPVHARGPHQRRVVHQREDVQHRLARPPHGERRVRAGQRRCQAEPPGTWRPQSVATRRGRTPTS